MAQKASLSTSNVNATSVLPGGYHNFKVHVPGSREGRLIPVVSIPCPAQEHVATVSTPQRPALEPVATVSALPPPLQELEASVTAAHHPALEPEASADQKPTASSRTKECNALCVRIRSQNLCCHVESYQLPWCFVPELACWKCQQSAYNLSSLLEACQLRVSGTLE